MQLVEYYTFRICNYVKTNLNWHRKRKIPQSVSEINSISSNVCHSIKITVVT